MGAWLVLGALLALLCLPSLGLGANAIQIENALPGTPGWRVPDAPYPTSAQSYAGLVTSIDGYTVEQSVAPGGTVDLHVAVATSGLRYRIKVYRLGWYGGTGARLMVCLPMPGCLDRAGVVQPSTPPAMDPVTGKVEADWPVTDSIAVGQNWVSGYYLAMLELTTGPDTGKARWVPFIVRPPSGSTSPLLVQVPVNTWLAYDGWGGKSLYDNKSANGIHATKVSFARPYWGAQYHLLDHEYQLVRYLEREGFDATYATDVDINRNPGQVLSHRLLMLAGHGEYWTRTMRDTAELARDSGVNIASMGANTGYWQVRYEDGEHTVVGYKNGAADPVADPGDKTILFRDLGRPECELFGVQYDDSWSVDSVVRNYGVVASAAGNPWFQGTGLTAGATTTGGTVGYEWDFITPGCNHPPVTSLLHWDDGAGGFPPADAVTYTAPSGARVFSAGSNQFAWGLDGWRDGYTSTADTRLMAFMRNMITDLTAGEPPPPPPNQAPQASFSVTPGAPLVGQSVTFADTSSDLDGTIASRAWDLNGDGQFDDGTGTTATRTFTAAGTYTVRLQVTDDDGAPAVATRQVVVATTPPPPPPPPANLLSNPSFETNTSAWSGYQATLAREAQAGAPAGSYVAKVTRSTGTSFTIDDGARAVPNTTAGISYTAEAWVKAASASSVGKPIQIKLRERTSAGTVVADVGSANIPLTNAWQRITVSLVTTTTGGNLGVRVSHGGAVAGDAFYVDALVLGGGGDPPPPPPNQAPTASFSQTPAAPIAGQQVSFADTSSDADGTIAARAWDLNNDGVFDDGTGTSAQRTFAAAGTYTVRLQVTDDDGAPAVATRQVVVNPVPANQPPTASFSQTPTSPIAGQQVTFADTSSDADGTIASRAWDLNDDGQYDDGTGTSAQRTFAVAGTYTVRLQVTDSGGASSAVSRQVVVAAVPVNQAPIASFSQTPSAPIAGQQVSFADTSSDADGTIAARAWDLNNDGVFDDGTGTSAQRTFAAAGTYTVRLQVTDDDGAPAVATRQVVVVAAPPPVANLLSNPSFETNTSGWSPYQSTLVREAQAGAPAGGFVVRVTRSTGTSFTIDDGARAVPSLVAGTTYTAEAWVKAASASSVGKPIQIKLRERTASGTVVADVGSANVSLTNAWQKITVSRTVVTAGGNLGLRVSHGNAVAGDAFFADAAVLRTGT